MPRQLILPDSKSVQGETLFITCFLDPEYRPLMDLRHRIANSNIVVIDEIDST
jgi:uncharacterized protein (DUF1330 family)